MKKFYYLFAITFSLLALQIKAQTQGDITLAQMPSFNHDQNGCWSYGQMPYTITIANSFLGDSIKVINTSYGTLADTATNHTGQNPWVISLFIQAPYFASDQILNNVAGTVFMPGPTTKIINVHSHSGLDTMYNINNDIMGYVSNPCLYGNVSGKVYIDYNGNCIFDGTDAPLQSINVGGMVNLASPSSTPSVSASGFTDWNGVYNMAVQQTFMTDYTVQIPSNYQFIFPSSLCSPITYTNTTLPQVNVDFSLQCTSNIDVQCYANSMGIVRPNHSFYMYPYVSNTGCFMASGLLKLVLDNRVTYSAGQSSNPANTINGDTLIWNYSDLTNLSGGGYWNSFFAGVHLTPNLTVNIGDTLHFRVMTNIPTGDVDNTNNDYFIDLPVVNSYDPNIKEVSPKGIGINGNIPQSTETLTYAIHFQNTGSAIADNISIVDTLNTHIIPNSLQILGASHPVYPEWIAPGVVKFNFYGINLPDSNSNETASHGVIRFSVKLNMALPMGTQIKNTAGISFDYNIPILTNTTVNTINLVEGIKNSVNQPISVNVYPNPFSDNTTFSIKSDKLNETYSFEMFDALGKVVKSLPQIAGKEFIISRNGLQNGVYFYKIYSAESTVGVGKLIVR